MAAPKRFLVFGIHEYGEDQSGGWRDLLESFNTLEEALTAYPKHVKGQRRYKARQGWYGIHIVDLAIGEIVESY